MGTLWFCLVAVMIAGLRAARRLRSRRRHHAPFCRADPTPSGAQVLATIGPVWDGNEVWLLAAGGTLYFAFPALYASGFSGFYLPLMIVLWLLILRGISIEFRSHVHSPVWAPLWDAVFCFSSALLAIFYGAALGNVVRGVPLDASGYFFEPLWTNFRLGGRHRHSRLVHDSDRRDLSVCSDAARRHLADAQNLGRGSTKVARPGTERVVGRGCTDDHHHLVHVSHSAADLSEFRCASVGLCFSGDRGSRACCSPMVFGGSGRRSTRT